MVGATYPDTPCRLHVSITSRISLDPFFLHPPTPTPHKLGGSIVCWVMEIICGNQIRGSQNKSNGIETGEDLGVEAQESAMEIFVLVLGWLQQQTGHSYGY